MCRISIKLFLEQNIFHSMDSHPFTVTTSGSFHHKTMYLMSGKINIRKRFLFSCERTYFKHFQLALAKLKSLNALSHSK